MMLAAELALAHVDVAIVERRPSQDLPGSRAGGLHARTIEVLDQRGVAERFLAQGTIMQVAGFAMIRLDISDAPTRHGYGLALPQEPIERGLAAWVAELGVPVYRGLDVTGFGQDDAGVDVALSDGRTLRAAYLVGCDGGRSAIRKAAGIDFAGWDATVSYLIAEASAATEPAWGARPTERGINGIAKLDDGKRIRVVLTEPEVRRGDEPSEDELRAALTAVYGTDFGVHGVTWLSRFSDMARQAVAYRAGRVLVAGDAAHVHSPTGGQGLNTGVQDAVNLGWKLAQVVRGTSPASLLDSYHAERHPVAARVLTLSLAQTALMRGDARRRADEGGARDHGRAPRHGRAAAALRRDDVGPRHPLRPRRGPPAARPPRARSRRGHRRRAAPGLHAPARGAAGAARSRAGARRDRARHRAVGGPGGPRRRRVPRALGAAGARRGGAARRRADPPRRSRRVGRRRHRRRPARRADHLVRAAAQRRVS
jgi:3-(3-hydroxy-phenyl)propionate hydroxylase